MRVVLSTFVLIITIYLVGCASSTTGLKVLPEPESNTVMVIGCVLLENIDRDLAFAEWNRTLKVIILRRERDGTIKHYTVETDRDGYYCLPNLPEGAYLLKAVIFQVPGERPQIIVNDFQSAVTRYYLMRHPENGIEYTANWFPAETNERIIDQHITWFGLRRSRLEDMTLHSVGKVLVTTHSEKIETKRLSRDGYRYSREAPLVYLREKFPDSSWWEN